MDFEKPGEYPIRSRQISQQGITPAKMSVLARALWMACVCVALRQTSEALTCYGCPFKDFDAGVGCDTNHTCQTSGSCYNYSYTLTTAGESVSGVRRCCVPATEEGEVGCEDFPPRPPDENLVARACFCKTDLCNVNGQPPLNGNGQSPLRVSSLLLLASVLMLTSQLCG